MFEQLDRNKDTLVTAEEINALSTKVRHCWTVLSIPV